MSNFKLMIGYCCGTVTVFQSALMDLLGNVKGSDPNKVSIYDSLAYVNSYTHFPFLIKLVSRSKPRQIPPLSGRQLPSANALPSTTVQQRLSSRAKRWICREKLHAAY